MSPYRNAAYLKFIRSLPCCMTGAPADDAHHVINTGMNLSGMAMKPDDIYCVPLTRDSHNAVHAIPELQRLQPEWLEDTWRRALWHFGPDSEVGQRIREARQHLRMQLGQAGEVVA